MFVGRPYPPTDGVNTVYPVVANAEDPTTYVTVYTLVCLEDRPRLAHEVFIEGMLTDGSLIRLYADHEYEVCRTDAQVLPR